MKILLITPPLIQPNTPYAATPLLTSWLRSQGYEAVQEDLSLKLLLRFYSREGLSALCDALAGDEDLAAFVEAGDEDLAAFVEAKDDYLETIDEVMAFLQGRAPELAAQLSTPGWLPAGPALASAVEENEALGWAWRGLDQEGVARHLASLYLDDLAEAARVVDPAFGFSRYGESLARSLSEFAPFGASLEGPDTLFTRWLRELAAEVLMAHLPDMVALTVPFPGCLPGALRIAQAVKKLRPRCHVTMGGGYVNTELRALRDPAVFEWVDSLTLDSGMLPLLRLAEYVSGGCGPERLVRTFLPAGGGGNSPLDRSVVFYDSGEEPVRHAALPAPVYEGLLLDRYFGLFEVLNPVMRLWSDGRWNRLVLAHGCCWSRCAFCDTTIDYICRYDPADAGTICDWMEAVMAETSFNGFHFVDEALPPDLLERVCDEILRRGLVVEWWGNIRFEKRLSRALIRKMAQAGCLAVTGGLETACDRSLALMQKGIRMADAERVIRDCAESGILTHAYLMYGFPTQTLREVEQALERVRRLMDRGWLHSGFWHRFALTTHSVMTTEPARFGLVVGARPDGGFAVNEIPFEASFDYDLEAVGEGLHAAMYNYNLGVGLDLPVAHWIE
jgi:hypothetical protein